SFSSSLVIIIGENLQRPGAGEQEWYACKIAAQEFARGADCIEIFAPHEHRQLTLNPAMLRRERQKRAADPGAKLGIDLDRMRAPVQRFQVRGAGREVATVGAGGRVGGGGLQ